MQSIYPSNSLIKNYNKTSQIVYVSPQGNDTNGDGSANAPYLTIAYVMSQITDAGSTKYYQINVAPGVYTETNPITIKDYVSIVGGVAATIIKPSTASSNLFVLGEQNELRNLYLIDVTSASALYANTAVEVVLDRVHFNSCQYGLRCNHASFIANIFQVSFFTNFTSCIYNEAGTLKIDGLIVGSTGSATNVIYGYGTNSKIYIFNLDSISSSVTNGVVADNGAFVNIKNSAIENSTNAFTIGSSGSSTTIKCSGVSPTNSVTYDLLIQSATGIFKGYNANFRRDKTSITSGASVNGFGYDEYVDKFTSFADMKVGKEGSGSSLSVGNGDTYKFNVNVLTYDGAVYADVTNNASISFPNVSAGTIIYIGDINPFPFYGFRYTMGNTSINLGIGSIVWEYYDGGTTSWLAMNTLNTISGYSDSYANQSFTSVTNGQQQSIRFDQGIKTGLTEVNPAATGHISISVNSITGYWIRVRIATAITTSPTFSDVRCRGSFIQHRSNGTTDYSGLARAEKLLSAFIGNGTATSQTVSMSTNVSYRFLNNSFADSVTDTINWRFPITDNIDTSSGLMLYMDAHTPATTASQAEFKIYTILATSTSVFNGGLTETSNTYYMVVAGGSTAYVNRHLFLRKIDISNAKNGDIIYASISRNATAGNANDTLSNYVATTNIYIKYREHQDGSNYL